MDFKIQSLFCPVMRRREWLGVVVVVVVFVVVVVGVVEGSLLPMEALMLSREVIE